ncbi:MAG: hypothetical protein AAGB31_11055 [Bdellovibrio sp.]
MHLRILLNFITLCLLAASPAPAYDPVFSPEISEVFTAAKSFFLPLAQSQNGTFRIEIDHDRETSSAGAYRPTETDFQITVDKGVLTNPRTTLDSLRMMICHEGGHLFGGFPFMPAPPEWEGPVNEQGLSLFSAEGQADYYAPYTCFAKLIQGTPAPQLQLPMGVVQQCDRKWGSDSESSQSCQRAAQAAYDFLRLTWDFPISFETLDTSQVEATNNSTYPNRQCRLDTFLAGALQEPRPSCWFKKLP